MRTPFFGRAEYIKRGGESAPVSVRRATPRARAEQFRALCRRPAHCCRAAATKGGRFMDRTFSGKRSRFAAEHGASIAAVAACSVALGLGWHLFKDRMVDRDERARAASSDVARIW